MIRTFFHQVALALTALFLAATLILPYNGGYPLAYGLMGLSLVLIVALLVMRAHWELGPAGWCFIGAFGLLTVAFGATGNWPFLMNFVFLLAFIPLSSWFGRFAAPDSARVVSLLALTGTVLSALTAGWEVFHFHAKRAVGWGSDPIWSAEAALILGFLALVGFTSIKSRWRFALLLGPALGLLVVLLSGSRGPLVAAPVILLALTVTTFHPWWRQIATASIVVVIAAAVLLPFWPAGLKRVERTGTVIVQLVTTGTIEEHSAGARMAFWKAGYQAFLHSPIVGYGWKKHVRAAYAYLPDKGKAFDAKGSELRGNPHLHADILDMGVSAGSLGLLAYGLILLAPLAGAIRSRRDSQYGARLTGAIVLSVGYAVCGLSYLMFGFEYHTTLYPCLAAIVLGFCRDAPATRAAPVPPI